MTLRQTLGTIVLFFGTVNFAVAQVPTSGQQLESYLLKLSVSKVDSILIVRSGCVGCEVIHNGGDKVARDEEIIRVLSQHEGKFEFAVMDGRHEVRVIRIDTSSVFEDVNDIKSQLIGQADFYKTASETARSKDGFYPPEPAHYSFEELSIHVANFIYKLELKDLPKTKIEPKIGQLEWDRARNSVISQLCNYSRVLGLE